MFKKDKIDIIYRLICLITFMMVILCVKSLVTLAILGAFFLLLTKSENNLVDIFLYIFTFLAFYLAYLNDMYGILKFIIIIDYCHYFLNLPNIKEYLESLVNKKIDKKNLSEKEESEYNYFRFKKSGSIININTSKADSLTTMYITVHFAILFLAIMVGTKL